MAEIKIKKNKVEVLKVNIGENTYSLPLGADIPYKQLQLLKTQDGIFDFLSKYFPEDVMEILTTNDIVQIFTAWSDATQQQTGVTPGES